MAFSTSPLSMTLLLLASYRSTKLSPAATAFWDSASALFPDPWRSV